MPEPVLLMTGETFAQWMLRFPLTDLFKEHDRLEALKSRHNHPSATPAWRAFQLPIIEARIADVLAAIEAYYARDKATSSAIKEEAGL